MALDEALLESVIRGGAPVVRLYTWRPATLSLGVNQPIASVDRAACRERGFGLVRRITGGRAVLHQHELTYAVIAPRSDPRVSGGVIESYRKISAALVRGLRVLGADVALAEPDAALVRRIARAHLRHNGEGAGGARSTPEGAGGEPEYGAVCFDVATAYELTAGGRKLVGSAQARRGDALLQHGSILLDIDFDAWTAVFTYEHEQARRQAAHKLPARMTSLRQELGRTVTPAEVCTALSRAFEEEFAISLELATLSAHEEAEALRLATTKYATEAWTARM
jgi:lipoate-protein ligase A